MPAQISIDLQDRTRSGHISEQVADDLMIHRRTRHQSTLLRRIRRRTDQQSRLRIRDQEIIEEQRRLLHHRIGPRPQEIRIPRVQEMLPEMLAEPGPTCHPDAVVRGIDRRRTPPQIRVVMHHPATGLVIFTRRCPAGFRHFLCHLKKGLMHRREIQHLRRPVVHLCVDVGRVLAAPGWRQEVIPDALKIGGSRPWTGGRNEQVAPVLNVQGHKRRILHPCKFVDAPVRRFISLRRPPQIDRKPVEMCPVFPHMRGPDARPGLSRQRFPGRPDTRHRIPRDVLVINIIRAGRQVQFRSTCTFDHHPPIADTHPTTFRLHLQL